MRKFGFKISYKNNGFNFYTNSTSTVSLFDYIKNTTNQDYFEFTIHSNTSYFLLFTEFPINWIGQITYNSQDCNNQNLNGSIQLHETLNNEETLDNIGNLKIYFDDIKRNEDSLCYSKFEINYLARATFWQYYVINKNKIPLGNPVVKEKGNMVLEGPKNVILETGEEALLFTSTTISISLSEIPKYKFDLINTINSPPKIIIKGLPNPDISKIEIVKINGENQVTSPIYIYL